MSLIEAERLYDISTRKALYVEGVKARESVEFNKVVEELREDFRRILGKVQYSTLDALTKLELNRLIASLRDSQSRIYNAYTVRLIQTLQDFMQADLKVSRIVFATGLLELEPGYKRKPMTEAEAVAIIEQQQGRAGLLPLFGLMAATTGDDRMWSSTINAPMPANGLYLLPFIRNFAAAAVAGVENAVRKAHANRLTVDELNDLVASPAKPQGVSSQYDRVKQQGSAVIATTVAHVSSMATAAVSSALFLRYRWDSVLDNRTTDICWGRNGKTYRYGAGPLPPAHINCRSSISPTVGNDDFEPENLSNWYGRQPSSVQDDLTSKTVANGVRSGTVKAADLPKVFNARPLTVEQYAEKAETILTQ